MAHRPSNAPAPDELLLTAREALKSVLSETDGGNRYIILMAMNAMGIAARAMQAGDPPPLHCEMRNDEFRQWARRANADAVTDLELIDRLRRNVEARLAVANPRFKPEAPSKDQS